MSIWNTITEDRLMTKKLPKRVLASYTARGKSGRHRFAGERARRYGSGSRRSWPARISGRRSTTANTGEVPLENQTAERLLQ